MHPLRLSSVCVHLLLNSCSVPKLKPAGTTTFSLSGHLSSENTQKMTEAEIARLEKENAELEAELARAREEESRLTTQIELESGNWNAEQARFLEEPPSEDEPDDIKELRTAISMALKTRKKLESSVSELDDELQKARDALAASTGSLDRSPLHLKLEELQRDLQKFEEISEAAEQECVRLFTMTPPSEDPEQEELRKQREEKLIALEELRLRQSQLAFLRTLEVPPDGTAVDPETAAQNEKELNAINEKLEKILKYRVKTLHLKCEIAELERKRDAAAAKDGDDNSEEAEFVRKIEQARKQIEELHDESATTPEFMHKAFEDMKVAKSKFISQQMSYFQSKIHAFKVQLDILSLKVTTGAEKQSRTVKRYANLYGHLVEFGEMLHAAMQRVCVVNQKLEREIAIYEAHKASGEPIEKLEEELEKVSAEVAASIDSMKSEVDGNIVEINKICEKLRIPPLQEGETAKQVFTRISWRIAELRKPMPENVNMAALEEHVDAAREENEKKKKKKKDISDKLDILSKKKHKHKH